MVDVIETWFRSGEYAVLGDITLKPRSHGSVPLVNKSEEGLAYYLVDDANKQWILKKFFPNAERDRAYLQAIPSLIPTIRGFESGFSRRILSASSASHTPFSINKFSEWIDGAILMPEIIFPTWTRLAESIRNESLALSLVERLALCRSMSELVVRLESARLAHRDLSCANVLIDRLQLQVHFIDWESLYHPTLAMQSNTSWGTEGYTARFAYSEGPELAYVSWQEKSDRFALTVLNCELLAMNVDSRCVDVGGLISQTDINNGFGSTISEVYATLAQVFPPAANFLNQALNASNFAECASPSAWINAIENHMK